MTAQVLDSIYVIHYWPPDPADFVEVLCGSKMTMLENGHWWAVLKENVNCEACILLLFAQDAEASQ